MSNKKISADIVALTPNVPGQAIIQITGWDLADGLKFKIQGNSGRGYLNETAGRSEWGSSEYWFQPQSVEHNAEQVLIYIDQSILDPLLEAGARYKLFLSSNTGSQESSSTLNIAEDVYPSTAAGSNTAAVSGGTLATPEHVSVAATAPTAAPELQVTQTAPQPTAPAAAQPEPQPVSTPEAALEPTPEPAPQPIPEPVQPAESASSPASAEPKKDKGKVILFTLLGLLFVALLAGLGWWLSQQKLPGFGNDAPVVDSALTQEDSADLDQGLDLDADLDADLDTDLVLADDANLDVADDVADDVAVDADADLDAVDDMTAETDVADDSATNVDADTDVADDSAANTSADTTPAVEPVSANSGCALASMGTVDELQFVQSCLQETQDSNTLLAVIQHAKANNHCGIAQRLYANRAQSGDNQIALAYAQEYDPQFYKDNTCFKAADTETALYWYETVLISDPNNAQAMQRAEELAP